MYLFIHSSVLLVAFCCELPPAACHLPSAIFRPAVTGRIRRLKNGTYLRTCKPSLWDCHLALSSRLSLTVRGTRCSCQTVKQTACPPRELADRLTDQFINSLPTVPCSRGGRPRSSLILISITNSLGQLGLLCFWTAQGLWPTRSTAGGLCRRIRPGIIILSWSWLIRSEPKSPPNEPLAPNARSQGLKTPTQHPNFSLTAECAAKNRDVHDILRPRFSAPLHCCTACEQPDPVVVSTWECRHALRSSTHKEGSDWRWGPRDPGTQGPVELDSS